MNEDLVEDFENYSDDGFDENVEKQRILEEDAIVDEIGEDDDLKLIDEEIMNSHVGKSDARKLKDLIGKIDDAAGKPPPQPKKPIDAATKFSSSSKVVVSKYNKSSSKTNLHDSVTKSSNNSIFAGRMSPTLPTEPKYKREADDTVGAGTSATDKGTGENEDEIDDFIKKHLEDDEDEGDTHEKLTAKAKLMLGEEKIADGEDKESQDMLEESLSDSEVSGSFDSE